MSAQPFYGASTGVFKPVIRPQNYNQFDGCASPMVAVHPETYNEYLIFTGWTSLGSRHLYRAEITNSLEVSNITKIADATSVPGGSIEGAYGIYDKNNSEWLLGATSPDSSTGLHLLRFNSDFSTLKGVTSYSVAPKDSAATAWNNFNDHLLISYVDNNDWEMKVSQIQLDFQDRPINGSLQSTDVLMKAGDIWAPDVHHVIPTGGGLMVLFEDGNSSSQSWTIHPAFVGYAKANNIKRFIAMPSNKPLLQEGVQRSNLGHPTYSTELGRPLVMFSWFRQLGGSGGSNKQHEIWATEPKQRLTDPTEWYPFETEVQTTSGTSEFMELFGAEKIIAYLDTSNTGTVTLRQAMVGKQLQNGNYATESWSVSATGVLKHVFTDPLEVVQFDLNFAPNSLSVIVK